jgi:hypothetical protein
VARSFSLRRNGVPRLGGVNYPKFSWIARMLMPAECARRIESPALISDYHGNTYSPNIGT